MKKSTAGILVTGAILSGTVAAIQIGRMIAAWTASTKNGAS